MWFSALATLILLESTTCLPQYDMANKDVYEIQEDTDTNSVKFINPKAEEPVLREITYYHLVERAYDGTVQTDKVLGSFNDHDLSTERPTTNSHGHEFEIDLLHRDDDQSVQDDHMDDQDTDVLNRNRGNAWYLHTSYSTESPHVLEPKSEEFDQSKPEHHEDWFKNFMNTFVVTEAEPSPAIDQVLPLEVGQHDWFNPAAKVEPNIQIDEATPTPTPGRNNWFNRPAVVLNPTEQEHVKVEESEQPQSSEGIVDSSYEQNEHVEALNPTPVEENRELVEEYVTEEPQIAPEVEESEVLDINPEEYVVDEEVIGQEEVFAPEVEESEILEDMSPPVSSETAEIVPENTDSFIPNTQLNPEVATSEEHEIVESDTLVDNPAEVDSDAGYVETEGEFEVIEDPILTAAIIEAEGLNLEDQDAGEGEIVEETVFEQEGPAGEVEGAEVEEFPKEEVETAEDAVESEVPEEDTENSEIEEQRQRFYQLYQSPMVLQDRYMKLRRDMPNMNIREPDVAVEEITTEHSRRKRSAMQPEDEIPEAPILPPLNYDSLPEYIRSAISTDKPDEIPEAPVLPPLNYDSLPENVRTTISTDKPTDEENNSPKDERPIEAEREPVDYNRPRSSDMFETIRMVQQQTGLGRDEVEEGLEESDGLLDMPRSEVRTYGMSINGDHGYVWNDMFSNPGMHYNVGVDSDDKEGHKEEERPLIEEELEEKLEPDNNKGTELEIEEQSNPENNEDNESEKPDEHIVGLEPNHEGGHTSNEDNQDIYVNFDKKKRPLKPAFDETDVDVQEDEVKEEADDAFEDAILNELMKKGKFWRWLSDWTATYIDLFSEKLGSAMQEEISKVPATHPITDEKPAIDTHSDNIEAKHPIDDDKHSIIEENDEDDHPTTIFINGKEISLARTSNWEEELDNDDISEGDWMKKSKRGHYNKQNHNSDKEPVKIVSKAIYGNTIGNEKVTNIFVFFPENGNNKIMESFKPILDSKDEIEPQDNKEISIEENASSISDLDITKPQESSPANNIEQLKEPEATIVESTHANEPELLEKNVSTQTEADKDKINPTLSEISLETVLGTDFVNTEVPVESAVASSEPIQPNKEENFPTTEIAALDNSGIGQLDERIIVTSTPRTEESAIITEKDAITEEPTVSEVISENVTPILSVTEEPKTSQPIAETVPPSEQNFEEIGTSTEILKEDLMQDRGDQNIDEHPEPALIENQESIESNIESGPSEISKLSDDNLETTLTTQEEAISSESSPELPLSELKVATPAHDISTMSTDSESDNISENDKPADKVISTAVEITETEVKPEEDKTVSTEVSEIKPSDDNARSTAPYELEITATEVNEVKSAEVEPASTTPNVDSETSEAKSTDVNIDESSEIEDNTDSNSEVPPSENTKIS